jgi:membrane-associated phospholipid phosphatase
MRDRIARLVSNIFNPFLMSASVLVLLSFKDAPSVAEALKWAAISLAISVLPVFSVVIWLVCRKKMDGFFDNTRGQRRSVYIVASALGVLGCGLMWGLKAPEMLSVTFTTGFVELVVFMGINHYWKISLHTAFAAGAVTIVSLVYGLAAIWTILLLPPVAWARIALKQHSIAQVATGALLAAVIVVAIFGGLGLIMIQ